MRRINWISTNEDWTLDVCFTNGEVRKYDVRPLLQSEAFRELEDVAIFKTARNGGYFVAWDNDADLSADTLYLEGIPVTPAIESN
ncbi:DUF2442 domain-containing protein [Geomonas subterranea]|uniref:DUF2442 domain-containing protein n=1 Tax=Geomonas subterranea TaxID=2847989 RepID=A0ABX8LB59_9BACT|nr:DUF2442 domain-containing protein [Geomonas subterranea]QXE89238.1 DUF2442 domain-containing protein [Geomonas subterranea]QXM08650.1 DUF2442 domain-containing protein [Geomonas subterranea]